jgi:hypothetical protein
MIGSDIATGDGIEEESHADETDTVNYIIGDQDSVCVLCATACFQEVRDAVTARVEPCVVGYRIIANRSV